MLDAMVTSGREALDRGDWAEAQVAFEAAIASGPCGSAYEGLALALFWQARLEEAVRKMELAYAAFRRQGDSGQAAWAALWIAGQYLRIGGNHAVARGWAGRCERLLAVAEPCAELGRVILVRALATNDWGQIERAAGEAMAIAQRFGDTDYEAIAVAYTGLAMLSTGRLSEGLTLLDEAMAAATAGEVRAPEAVGQIYCALLSGCERTVDVQRAEQWSRAAQPFLHAYRRAGLTGSCRALYAAVLMAVGRWSEAERELLLALETFERGARAMRADALVRLADLRVRQGRLDEASGLLAGSEDHPDAQRPLAELELSQGRPGVAAALLERRIHQLGAARLQAGPLLACLVETHVAGGNLAAARRAADALAALAETAGDSLRGLARLAAGLMTAAEGGDPVPELEVALDHLQRAEMAWEASRARMAIAEAIGGRNPEFAIREARLAMAGFAALGARPGVDRAASLLRRLGVRAPAGARTAAFLSRREEEVAQLVGLGLSNEQIAGRLFLSQRTVESHVSSILRKLGMASRVEIAGYMARRLAGERESV